MPVSVVRFVAPTDVPGNDSTSSSRSGGKVSEKRWEWHYIPQIRHFRCAYFLPNAKEPHTIAHVHESRVSVWT